MPAIEPALCFINAAISGIALSPTAIVALAIALCCLIISGFVSGSEIAFFSLTPQQIADAEDTRRGKALKALLEKPERLLATILIANNLVNVTIVVLCNFALGPVFASLNAVLSFVLQTIILTFLILLFGEIIPKLYANHSPMGWAKGAVDIMGALMRVFSPLAGMLESSSSIVKKVVPKRPDSITTDDLSQALEITAGTTKPDKDMLEGILKFGDTTAAEIMTPRIDITDLDISDSFDKVVKVVIKSGYSRMPVCDGSQDNIKGILYARDLLPYIGRESAGFRWQTLLREPYYVPESRMIDDILEDFRRRKQHLAIVVDEYGGTQGLVTMEDVLEEIVGDINDEYDPEDQTFKRLRDDTYIFEGRTLLNDFFRITGLDETDYEPVTQDVETVAGMLLAIKGDFPKEKEPLVYGHCRFLVLEVVDHRIVSVRVKVMPEIQLS